jgi:transcriptional regulator with XRE-family HTH domain
MSGPQASSANTTTRRAAMPYGPPGDAPPGSHELGHAIRNLRRAKGLTIEALAFDARLHPTYLSGIERGERNPTWAKLCGLASALGVPISVLVHDAEHEAWIARITREVERSLAMTPAAAPDGKADKQ